MKEYSKPITKKIYDNAKNGYVASQDMDKVFSISQLCGYGVYLPRVHEKNGEYYCTYQLGNSCD